MVSPDVRAVLVLEDERLVGILTKRDVLRAVTGGIRWDTVVAGWLTYDP